MAKFKPAKARNKNVPAAGQPQAIGCIILISLVMLLVMLSIYFTVVSK